MSDRNKILAKSLVNYSCALKPGEKVLINVIGFSTLPLIKQIVKETYKAGGYPYVELHDPSVTREIMLGCKEEQLEFLKNVDMFRMKGMDAYIGVRGNDNSAELSDVPPDNMALYNKFASEVTHERVNNTKWVVLRYPNNSMAQQANMSLEEFEDFYYSVCNLNYDKMAKAMENLTKIMDKTDRVRIVGKGTDLSFSIKDIPSVDCAGLRNIPDGEVYTAPVKNSINGYITYNTSSNFEGFTFENIYFEIKDGKIIDAKANNSERLNKILDTDEGARYFGEFAFGVNPYILKPMNDILFDEKIMGSIHFTPGMSYESAPNGNDSKIHWDLVLIQTKEYGGGEIYFDDKLIRKDGMFVIDELTCLNPENLK